MKTYYNNNCSNQVESCNSKPNYYCEDVSECNKYKQASDELYLKALCIQEESKKLSCSAQELEEYAKELEYQAQQAISQAHIIWSNAHKLELEAKNTLDLASFYCNKAIDCYKNLNNLTSVNTPCSSSYNCNNAR